MSRKCHTTPSIVAGRRVADSGAVVSRIHGRSACWRLTDDAAVRTARRDALGNPLGFFLTGGEAHDLVGADHLLPTMEADTLIADKAFDADERVLEPLAAAGKTAVIPPRANRSSLRDYDRPYGERHLIETFFAKIKQFRAIATRYEKTARNFLAAVQLVASVVWLN